VEPSRRWIVRAAAASVAAAAAAYRYLPSSVSYVSKSPAVDLARQKVSGIAAPAATPPAPAAPRTTGTLRVTSSPSGARVRLDGRDRGVTPLALDDVSFGRHVVVLQSAQGAVERTVDVAADRPAIVDESIFSGWVAVFSPIEVTVTEGGSALRPDERSEIMLAAGRHELRFANASLGFDQARTVDVKPGERQGVTLTPPRSTLSVTTSEPAEIWVDGTRVGDTPVTGAAMAIGTHELVAKRAAGGEQRQTITVTVKPFTTHVVF
jgi:hypothetical protein